MPWPIYSTKLLHMQSHGLGNLTDSAVINSAVIDSAVIDSAVSLKLTFDACNEMPKSANSQLAVVGQSVSLLSSHLSVPSLLMSQFSLFTHATLARALSTHSRGFPQQVTTPNTHIPLLSLPLGSCPAKATRARALITCAQLRHRVPSFCRPPSALAGGRTQIKFFSLSLNSSLYN